MADFVFCFQCSDLNDSSYSEKHILRRERKNMSVNVFQEQFNNSSTAETNFLLSSCIHHHWCIKHSLEAIFTGIQWRGRGGSWREDYSHHHQCLTCELFFGVNKRAVSKASNLVLTS
jgi:hypothetical protein